MVVPPLLTAATPHTAPEGWGEASPSTLVVQAVADAVVAVVVLVDVEVVPTPIPTHSQLV